MRRLQLVLSAALIACSASAFAQNHDDDGGEVSGGICQPGQYCPPPDYPGNPGNPGNGGGGGNGNGNGGGAPIDPSPYDPQPGYPNDPGHGGGYNGAVDHREVLINQYIRDQNIDLLRTVGISPYDSRGAMIESVEITTEPQGNNSFLELIADGRVEDRTYQVGRRNDLRPRRQLILGQNFSNLFLGVRGTVYVRSLAINLVRGYQNPGYPNNPGNSIVARGNINQQFYGPANVDIARAVNLNNYRGYRVASVTVNSRGSGAARILVNGMSQGQIYLGGRQTLRLQAAYIVGQNLNALNLLVDTPAQIDSVEVLLTR